MEETEPVPVRGPPAARARRGRAQARSTTQEAGPPAWRRRRRLPVYITEYDINLADDNMQAQVMQSQFTMFWNDPNVKGITLWGSIEGATWETNTGLMTSGGTMRPAMTWLVDFLKTH
jgi:GH35 family endo-1,4-beta-xylanase